MQDEELQEEIIEALDRADDEALARSVAERTLPDHPAPIVSGPEGADEFRRLYEEGISRKRNADPR
jgi:hypothetical protein